MMMFDERDVGFYTEYRDVIQTGGVQPRETLVCIKKTATRHKRGELNRSDRNLKATSEAMIFTLLQLGEREGGFY